MAMDKMILGNLRVDLGLQLFLCLLLSISQGYYTFVALAISRAASGRIPGTHF